MATPDQMASMIAAIVNGQTARDCPAVRTVEDKKVFDQLKAECDEIVARGGKVDVPAEWLG
jgi:hypothetical protein